MRVGVFVLACALSLASLHGHCVPQPTWYADNYLMAGRPSANDWDSVSVKDPSIVYDGGLWHCFFTMMDGTNWRMGYASAPTVAGLRTAPRTRMSALGSGSWMCAPQVFYFRPHSKWYMWFNNGISSTTTVGVPSSWAAPVALPFNDGGIDFTVISDGANVYAFYAAQDGSGAVKTRHTRVSNFPSVGWSSASVVAWGSYRSPHCYHSLADGKYYLTPEDISRHFQLWVADSLAGPFRMLYENWAGGSNLKDIPNVVHWTDQVSHGELIRASFDERIEIADINHLDFLIEGAAGSLPDYNHIPYKIGIIRNYVCPNYGQDCVPTPVVDPCATINCGAHGSCSNGTCVCKDGYTGANCNTPPVVDPCASINCGAHGSCYNGACICTDGYTGANCNTPPANGTCDLFNCGAHGSCINGGCVCTDGYSGAACNIPPATDPCAVIDCGAHGSCINGACVCTDGYSGAGCKTPPVDPCAAVNCGAHGNCSNGACVCKDGFTGANCNTPPAVDPCASINCGAHGSCSNGTCVCKDGYTGANCTLAPGPSPPTTVCATAAEDSQAALSCPAGQIISAITFASYGLPSGSCPSFSTGSCHAASSVTQVTSACVGKSSCSVAASNNVFGDPCSGTGKTLDIAAQCSAAVDPCAAVNCGAHGSCSSGVCACKDGYTGATCNTPPVDPCASVNCGAHGSCSNGACICTDGYTGATCNTPPEDPCASINCGAHGSCSNGTCVCKDGYTGAACSTPPGVDPCANIDCGAHGSCANGVCTCTDGFSGAGCKVPPGPPIKCFATATDENSNGYWFAFLFQNAAGHPIQSVAVVKDMTPIPLSGPQDWGPTLPIMFSGKPASITLPPYMLKVTDVLANVCYLEVNAFGGTYNICQ